MTGIGSETAVRYFLRRIEIDEAYRGDPRDLVVPRADSLREDLAPAFYLPRSPLVGDLEVLSQLFLSGERRQVDAAEIIGSFEDHIERYRIADVYLYRFGGCRYPVLPDVSGEPGWPVLYGQRFHAQAQRVGWDDILAQASSPPAEDIVTEEIVEEVAAVPHAGARLTGNDELGDDECA